MAEIIQSLWVGNRLSVMERLCISSFLEHGHPFHLYVYGDVEGIPEGTVVKDGNQILPESRIFKYTGHATYSGFSNFFRYKLLLERGGWWVDTDMICMRQFDFNEPFVFSSEYWSDSLHVNVGAIKAPAGSLLMQYLWDECSRRDPAQLTWGQIGPRLAAAAVAQFAVQHYVKQPHVFCPIHFTEWEKLLMPKADWKLHEETRAIHLWNELWRRENRPKDAAYPDDCLYESLKRRYLGREKHRAVRSKVASSTA